MKMKSDPYPEEENIKLIQAIIVFEEVSPLI